MKKLTLFLVAIFAMVNVANAQRAWAYDLELTPSVDSYKFAFKAVTAGDATLVFYKDGIEAATLNLGSVSAGDNTVTKTSEELLGAIQQSGDFTWGVKMSAGAIAAGSTLTEVGSADFYNMMGVVVDNNPESSTFSQIYVQQSYEYPGSGNTAERNKTQTSGIYIYDQGLKELNDPTNTGIVPNVPAAYKERFGKDRQAMKRLAINPKTGQLAFCFNLSLTGQSAAVWALDMDNLTIEAENLIDGVTAISKPNSLCFGENGVLYVLADAGYSSSLGSLGVIYKIENGVATEFSTMRYANAENAIAYDGRGGLWVAQTRDNLDTHSSYTHHNENGEVDYSVTSKSSADIKSLFQHTSGYMSKRGAIAYDVKRDILAVGGDKKVILFSVAYDATTGDPTLTKLLATPTIGSNIDGIAFDYAGDLYVVSSSSEKFQKFAVPTNNNTCTVPAKKSQVITLVSATPEYNVTVNYDNAKGSVTGGGTYLQGANVTLTATPVAHHRFVNWTGDKTSTDNPLKFTIEGDVNLTANFEAIPQITISVTSNDDNMGTVSGGGTYDEGAEVTISATAKASYRFVKWDDEVTDATRIFSAAENLTLKAIFEKVPNRAWAYDLKVVEEGDNYKFTFNTTAAGEATLLFADKDGNELVVPYTVGIVAAGAKTVTLAKTTFEDVTKDVYWSVKMDGEAIPAVAEITDQAKGIYDFYNMMGVVVDNDTESEDFGKIYIQQSFEYTSGTTADRNKTQKAGIFIYDQGLNELNPTNEGYKPTMPAGYTAIGKSRESFKRLAINPTNGNLVFGNNISGEGSVWSIGRDNLTAEATNIIEGATGIDKVNAICYDENGSLYVLANITTTSSKYNLYKFADGVQTELTLEGKKIFIDADVAMTSDGRGGLWIAQRRGGITQYSILSHINVAEDKVDFVLDAEGTYKDWFTGNCFRAAIAYNATESIVAVQGASKILLFKVSYDALTGAPSISKYLQVSPVGSSVDGLAFDYAGDLYTVNSGSEKFQKFTLPTDENICTVPAPSSQKLVLGTQCEVTVTVNDPAMGSVEGAGQYEKGAEVTLTPNPVAHHRFVNWTGDKTSTDNPLKFTIEGDVNLTANFEAIPTYTITTSVNDSDMGTVTGDGTYYEGTEVTLTAKANGGYVFVKWGDEVTDESRTFTAGVDLPETLTATFKAAVPRAWAYDLTRTENGENYDFTFKTTSAGTATLIFKNKDGNTLDFGEHTVEAITAEEKTITIAKTVFAAATKDIYWEVELAGEAITKMAEITDPTKGIYDIFAPQGIAVDNNTNSDYFGQVYVAAATDGTVSRGAQTRGIFVYNQALEELNSQNAGYLPSNATLTNTTRQAIHRVAVNPTNSQVAFAYNISGSTAVWSMNPENLAGDAVNLIDGAGITKANSICFDENGVLYVMDNANIGTGGKIYKIQDGVASVFADAQTGNIWGVEENAMTPDGRGGLWIAQNRWSVDDYPVLSHVNSNGQVDFAVSKNSSAELQALFPYDDNNASYRGQCAYYVADDILAFAGNKEAVLFKITYDANDVPTNLEKLMSTGKLGTNIDGVAFDYAGDLYVASETTHRMYKFVIPTTDNTCTVPAPASQAIIKEVRYNVTVNTVGNGTTTGAGEYVVGSTATLEATPAAHHQFVNWTYDSETSTDNPLSLVVNGDITVTANFEPVQYTLIAPTNDENKGTVTGAGTYNYGTDVEITATPKEGYKLLYWSDRSTENPRTITMTKNEAISAYFVKEYAEEPTFTITKVWENANVPASTGNGYQAVGWDGKIYMQDAGNSKIKTFSDGADTGTEYATSGAGQQIAIDEAGNLIVFNESFADATPSAILIYQNGSTTGKAVTFTLKDPARCDFFSASGDIYSAEGGYVYFYCAGKTVINRLKITNGAATAADVTTDVVGEAVYSSPQNTNYVMVDIFGNLVAHARSNAINAINVYTNESKAFTLPSIKMGTLGGCSFELGGKELWAYHAGASNYSSEWNIYNMTDGKFLSDDDFYAVDKVATTNYACNWLNVQVVDENTAYIYQFCPKKAAAVWKVSIQRDDLQEYTVTATANDASMGSVTGGGTYYEGATAILTATANSGYRFVNWTKAGVEVSTDATYTFTVTEDVELVANFEALPEITYELNDGVWNKYGWTSKKDMYDAFIADWKAYSGSTRGTIPYEDQFGIGKSNAGIPTTIQESEPIMEFMTQDKWEWLGQFLDALAIAQGKETMPTTAVKQMRFGLGNFFGEDNNQTGWVGAVDCSGDKASLSAFAPYWGQTFPMPTQPTEEVVLNAPYREGYEFDGWYTTYDFSGAAVTTVDENTDGTLYAKWIETIITVTIGEDVDNTTNLAPYVDKTVTATVTRHFGANKILTVTLPFDMNASQISTHFGNATVYEFYNVVDAGEELHLQFSRTTSIEAGKPYIIQTAASGYDAEDGFTIEGVTVTTELTPIELSGITMVPVLDGGDRLENANEYFLSNSALYCAGDYPRDLQGLRAYFTSNSSKTLRARVVFDDNEETSLPTITNPNNNVQKIVKNGQLIIIRGENQYNAQGQTISIE